MAVESAKSSQFEYKAVCIIKHQELQSMVKNCIYNHNITIHSVHSCLEHSSLIIAHGRFQYCHGLFKIVNREEGDHVCQKVESTSGVKLVS